jgi:hypothetical protein
MRKRNKTPHFYGCGSALVELRNKHFLTNFPPGASGYPSTALRNSAVLHAGFRAFLLRLIVNGNVTKSLADSGIPGLSPQGSLPLGSCDRCGGHARCSGSGTTHAPPLSIRPNLPTPLRAATARAASGGPNRRRLRPVPRPYRSRWSSRQRRRRAG